MRVRTSALILLVLSAVPAAAQVKYPAAPAKYRVDLRYKIAAEQNRRVRDFRDLTAALAKLGFVSDPREDADLDQLMLDAIDETKPRYHVSPGMEGSVFEL